MASMTQASAWTASKGGPSAWSNGFYGVSLETIGNPTIDSPLSTGSNRSQDLRVSEHVLHSIYSPSAMSKRSRVRHVTLPPVSETPKRNSANQSMDSEIFLSPAQFTVASSLAASPFSAITRNSQDTTATFRSLPNIEMLSTDYIQNCNSVEQLESIVNVLRDEGTCPSLLRIAEDRQQFVCNATRTAEEATERNETKTPGPPTLRATKTPTLNPLVGEFQSQLSPEMMIIPENSTPTAESGLILLPSGENSHKTPATSSTVTTPPTLNSLTYSDDGTLISPPLGRPQVFGFSARKNGDLHSEREKQLATQVERLTETIVELERAQQNEIDRLQALNKSKEETQKELEALENQVRTSEADKARALQSLERLRENNQRLSDQVRSTREAYEQARKKAQQVEKDLAGKVKALTAQLEQGRHLINESTNYQKQNVELNRLLRSTTANLDDLAVERTVLMRAILGGSAKEPLDLDKMSRKERRKLIAELAQKASSSRCAIDTVVGELRKSQQQLRFETNRRRQTQLLFEESKVHQKELDTENYNLSREVQRLMSDLEASRTKLEKHLQSTHNKQDNEWAAREAKLQGVIKGLRRQLRDETSMARLYRAEMLKSKHLGLEVVKLKKELKQVNGINADADETNTCPESKMWTVQPSSTGARGEPQHPRPEVGKENDVENGKTPPSKSSANKVKFEGYPSKSSEKTKPRFPGGRKALQDKVKQMRSPGASRLSMTSEGKRNPA